MKASPLSDLSADLFERQTAADTAREQITRPSLTYWQDAWRRLRRNKAAMVGLVILTVMTIGSIFIPMFSEYKFDQAIFTESSQPPSAKHWFGTDDIGRDLFVRVWTGGRISLTIGIVAAALNLIIGVLYGGIAGYLGGWIDDIMMRVVEIVWGIPDLLLFILMMLILEPGMKAIIIVLAMVNWIGMARLVRGQILQLKEQEFVLAARTQGAGLLRLTVRHLLPNAMGPILVSVTFAIPGAIFLEAALSFIGLGIRPPMASWGSLASSGYALIRLYPHMLIFPACAIAVTMLAFNLFGDGMRDALDPRLRGKH